MTDSCFLQIKHFIHDGQDNSTSTSKTCFLQHWIIKWLNNWFKNTIRPKWKAHKQSQIFFLIRRRLSFIHSSAVSTISWTESCLNRTPYWIHWAQESRINASPSQGIINAYLHTFEHFTVASQSTCKFLESRRTLRIQSKAKWTHGGSNHGKSNHLIRHQCCMSYTLICF